MNINQTDYEALVAKRDKSAMRLKQGRGTLLLLAIVTLVNTVLLITQSNSYFFFCAIIPYCAVEFTMMYCGKYPPEIYEGELQDILAKPLPDGFFICALIFAVLVIAALALCGYLTFKKKWAYITGFAIVMIDTVVFAGLISIGFLDPLGCIMDIIFRILIVVEVVIGLKGMITYNSLKDIQPPVIEQEIPVDAYTDTTENSN